MHLFPVLTYSTGALVPFSAAEGTPVTRLYALTTRALRLTFKSSSCGQNEN